MAARADLAVVPSVEGPGHQLAELEVEELRAENAELKETVAEQAVTIRKLKNHINKLLTRRDSTRTQALAVLDKQRGNADCAEFRGKSNRFYTPHGAYNLVVRRALSNASARGVGFMLARDLHHSTLSHWEIRLRAALNASARHHFAKISYEVATHCLSEDSGLRIVINQYRADATNSAAWQKCKLHTTEVETCATEVVREDTSVAPTMAVMTVQCHSGGAGSGGVVQ